MKHALTIAGSDCSGGAGLQADLKTFAAHGVYGMSAVVSVVAENTCKVLDIQDISPKMIEQQIEAVFSDIEVHAVKVGMLSSSESMLSVSKMLKHYQPQFTVIDPVMIAKGGCALMQPQALQTLITEIIPLAYVLTPNIPEAQKITGLQLLTEQDRRQAAVKIHRMGAKRVLIKGGHLNNQEAADDLLYDGKSFMVFTAKRIDSKNTHGTGCTFSSAIAANLALGYALPDAVKLAKAYITAAIAHSLEIGKGHGPTHHFYDLYQNGLTIKENEHAI